MKNFMRRVLLVITVLVLGAVGAKASHLIGGDISWDCLGNGQYKFYLKLYRDCQSQVALAHPGIKVWNHPTVTDIAVTLVSQTDISPTCNTSYGGQQISCGVPNPLSGAVEEFIYESDPVTLSGTPPSQGWVFTYNQCCRSQSIINLLNPGNQGFTFRAKMFAFNGQDANPCFDSSPRFAEKPATILCSGNPFTYNHNASDPDLDSLSYTWAPALQSTDTAAFDESIPYPPWVLYNSGYSYDNPMPGPSQNPNNVPANLDPLTGQITFTSYTQGYFVNVVKVTSWRCGQKISEVYREMQVIILGSCLTNTSPTVNAPFPGGSYTTTVVAGDVVTFTLSAQDSDVYPDNSPQNVSINATGSQFGANYTNANGGCLNPPCATLSPAPPASGPGGVSVDFNWQTTCDHIAISDDCARTTNSYNFVFQIRDDFCPAPAIRTATVTVIVQALPTVGPPSLRCVNTLANGTVELTWVPTVDTVGTFDSYHIFHSTDPNGPFTVIDSVSNINTSTYSHLGANGNSQTNYYYIKTRSGCFGKVFTASTDTLSNILLNVDNPGNGFANLTWNALSNPLPSTSEGTYHVFREFPLGTWVEIGTTSGLSYTDEIVICESQINYRVEIGDASSCISGSNIDGDVFSDVTPPPPGVIDSVSVDYSTGLATISWELSTASDAIRYVIYRQNDLTPVWNPIDTVDAPNTFYTYPLSLASEKKERYRIAALDSCGNIGLQGDIHNTMYLDTVFDACAKTVTLRWNNYMDWPTGVDHYDIYATADSGGLELIGTVGPNDTSFVHSSLSEFVTYCYFVQAVDGSLTRTSSSNIQCIFTAIPREPDFSYINLVTVPQTGGVDVYCYVDTAADIDYYEIYRSSDSLEYNEIDTVHFTGDTIIHYYDQTAVTDRLSYWYKVVAVDTCGVRVDTTDFSKTILLLAEGKADRKNYLDWSSYQGWPTGTQSFNIYRSISGIFDPTPLINVADGTLSYVDDVANITEGDGEFCYYIEALEDAGNPYGFQEASTSNVACAYQSPNFFVPNAFVPEGFNTIFIPVTVYVSSENYSFQVYNRWGQKIFETNVVDEGWDGKVEGTIVPQGAYVYYFQYQSAAGDQYEKRGTVTVIR